MTSAAARLVIDQEHRDWRIVVGARASPSEVHAGRELQYFLEHICGIRIPVADDAEPAASCAIVVGNNRQLARMGFTADWHRLGDEGFVIRTMGHVLVIAGGRPRGTLYGVYTFLEKYIGCRWFSAKVSHIPKKRTLVIGDIHDVQIPLLDYRETFFFDAFDGDWSARNKSNGHFARLEQRHGGNVRYAPPFVHTFNHLVPVERYYASHPEYFSEIGGERLRDQTQLCLTNEVVLALAIARVQQTIREHPDAQIVSVSQNDCGNPCGCARCLAIDEAEGGSSGTLICFVNRIAEAVEAQFPHVMLDTLAYQHTRKPPRTVRPRNNVIVRLSSMDCCFSHPMELCRTERGTSFANDLEQWGNICDKLYIWNYATNFTSYLMPFPNIRALQSNIRFFVRHGVKGIFEQGGYAPGGGGEFAELRAYVLAKLLWNPHDDADAAVAEFLREYYGPSSVPIREYIDLLHDKAEREHVHAGIFDGPDSPYLSREVIARAAELFDRAERLARDESVLLQRVRAARLPLRFVQLAALSVEGPGKRQRIAQFFDDLQEAGITEISEGMPLEQSRRMMEEGVPFTHKIFL